MNVQFNYLYRDAGNYKNFGEVVFGNNTNLSVVFVETTIRSCLMDHIWFVAAAWGVDDLHFSAFDWDDELDHDWHEFISLVETNQGASSVDIADFLDTIKRAHV